MVNNKIQEVVKKIFSDEKSKEEFISNPDNFLNKFALSAQEKKAVLRTHAKLGLITSNSQQLQTTVGPLGLWL